MVWEGLGEGGRITQCRLLKQQSLKRMNLFRLRAQNKECLCHSRCELSLCKWPG